MAGVPYGWQAVAKPQQRNRHRRPSPMQSKRVMRRAGLKRSLAGIVILNPLEGAARVNRLTLIDDGTGVTARRVWSGAWCVIGLLRVSVQSPVRARRRGGAGAGAGVCVRRVLRLCVSVRWCRNNRTNECSDKRKMRNVMSSPPPLLVRGGRVKGGDGSEAVCHETREPKKKKKKKKRVTIFAYLDWSNSWTLALTFDTKELNVRLPPARWGDGGAITEYACACACVREWGGSLE